MGINEGTKRVKGYQTETAQSNNTFFVLILHFAMLHFAFCRRDLNLEVA